MGKIEGEENNMKITVLLENISNIPELGSEHGLSLYIEALDKDIMFDTGETGIFKENAVTLGKDISKPEYLIISHGHYDHGGGLNTFLKNNDKARIFIRSTAFKDVVAELPSGELEDIGIDKNVKTNSQVVLTGSSHKIDNGLELFSDVSGELFNPSGNSDLKVKKDKILVLDDFDHEQNLVITEGSNKVLITGCAHRGIVNIIEHCNKVLGSYPTHVLGGFHLSNPSAGLDENPDLVKKIGEYLKNTGITFYTGHCTGLNSFGILKNIIGDKISYMATGDVINI